MKTLKLNADKSSDLQVAIELLQQGEVVAIPTETVYGLAGDASNDSALQKIFSAKNRPADHPLITHIANASNLEKWVIHISEPAKILIQHFWPGALTFLFDKQDWVSPILTGGLPTMGIRQPSHPVMHKLLLESDLALAAPSANPYQKLSPTTAEQVYSELKGRIAAVLDGGACALGTESTIVRISNTSGEVLRAGPITVEELNRYLPFKLTLPEQHQVAVSGNKAVHYQPKLPLRLANEHSLMSGSREGEVWLFYSKHLAEVAPAQSIQISAEIEKYRHDLYNSLYRLEQTGASTIIVESPPTDAAWADINDRLARAKTT